MSSPVITQANPPASPAAPVVAQAAAAVTIGAFARLAAGEQATKAALLGTILAVVATVGTLGNKDEAVKNGSVGATAQAAYMTLCQDVSAAAKFVYWLLAIITFGIFVAIMKALAAKTFGASGSLANAIKTESETPDTKAKLETKGKEDIESGETLKVFGNLFANPSEKGYTSPAKTPAAPATPAAPSAPAASTPPSAATPSVTAPAVATPPAPAAATPPAAEAVKDTGPILVEVIKNASDAQLETMEKAAGSLKDPAVVTTTEAGRQKLEAVVTAGVTAVTLGAAKEGLTAAQYQALGALIVAFIAKLKAAKAKEAFDAALAPAKSAAGYTAIFGVTAADDISNNACPLQSAILAAVGALDGSGDGHSKTVKDCFSDNTNALAAALAFDGSNPGDANSNASVVFVPIAKYVIGQAKIGKIGEAVRAVNALEEALRNIAQDTDLGNKTVGDIVNALKTSSILTSLTGASGKAVKKITGTSSDGLEVTADKVKGFLNAIADAAVAIAALVAKTEDFPAAVKSTFDTAAAGITALSPDTGNLTTKKTDAASASAKATDDAMKAMIKCHSTATDNGPKQPPQGDATAPKAPKA